MKTSEWLDNLDDGYRESAVENFIKFGWYDRECSCMVEALNMAFPHQETDEGIDFWYDMVCHYRDCTPLPPLPRVTRNRAWREKQYGDEERQYDEWCAEQDKTPPLVDKWSPFTQDAKTRKQHPVYSGFVKYFPDAMAMVANISWQGNEQHHPGTPLHWDRSKSADESDAMMRHIIDYTKDGDIEELAKVAWRAMAWLQKVVERE